MLQFVTLDLEYASSKARPFTSILWPSPVKPYVSTSSLAIAVPIFESAGVMLR